MVAKVSSGKSLIGVLNYHESKVRQGMARCIDENLFGQEASQISFRDKVKGIENFMSRNKRATSRVVHVSLNFHPSEKLDAGVLSQIAATYMSKIGFGEQPYLVYEHSDAGHPHVHIVSTNIQRDGQRIVLYNIGRNQSEKARKEVEEAFHLVQASGRRADHEASVMTFLRPLIYGKGETRRGISNVVRHVVRHYRFTSLPELNAILLQFNVVADAGSENSLMRKRGGLLYRVVDARGEKVGVPLKASAIYGKPTLARLEELFPLNVALRVPHRARVAECIDRVFGKNTSLTREEFVRALEAERIRAVFRSNDAGVVYGVTFVDHKNKVVFNGRDLGKAYGAAALLRRMTKAEEHEVPVGSVSTLLAAPEVDRVLRDLTAAESYGSELTPARQRKRKRRKRRRL